MPSNEEMIETMFSNRLLSLYEKSFFKRIILFECEDILSSVESISGNLDRNPFEFPESLRFDGFPFEPKIA